MSRKFDAIVLGAGAAGLMCAVEAGKRGKRVAVLELADKIGKKILISGGGRCNFTNIHCTAENFLSANPHFAKSALARYTPKDFIALVEKYRIPYHEKTLGQLFCDRAATDIVQMLEDECRAARVQIFLQQKIHEVSQTTEFVVRTADEEFRAPALVVATGGLSIPKIGATSLGYEIARKFGLNIQSTRPALVPVTLAAKDQRAYCDLSGVSMEVVVQSDGPAFREKMLITHRGLSGPAILQASSYWHSGRSVTIDLAPGHNVIDAVLKGGTRNDATLRNAFVGILPKRFADRWIELHPQKDWTNTSLDEFETSLHHWEIRPSGTEGYEKAEVTAGGVDTDELSSKTMEARKVPGLFFIGEVVDVTGQLGGFNFQWAWASGAAAGRSL
ncbi:MAG TPA: NAD(P)/FAD-dependent oxidoreductase [Candidatus Acidoferrum sp.]|nr:NAD(P)/FAD-dependent oxidoreductase [Candidatus Acidoferrum sp.]